MSMYLSMHYDFDTDVCYSNQVTKNRVAKDCFTHSRQLQEEAMFAPVVLLVFLGV